MTCIHDVVNLMALSNAAMFYVVHLATESKVNQASEMGTNGILVITYHERWRAFIGVEAKLAFATRALVS